MKKLLFILLCLNSGLTLFSQNTFSGLLVDSSSKEPVRYALVKLKGTGKAAFADTSGRFSLGNIPDGRQTLIISMVGYEQFSLDISFPLSSRDSLFTIILAPQTPELGEVIISSSRTDTRIENNPTRVEVLGTEEVEEESGIKPSNISSLLGDVAGIQTQQTSAITGNTDLRIQGLPGDYTLLLRDGLPQFGGYSGSFSVLQIPPLDLKQIEIIKGASSTLYGGGAIAGLINIISKTPKTGVQERYLLINQSTLHESNVNVFLSDRDRKRGYTFLGGGTYQKSIDRNKDGFSDLPLTETIVLHPTFFLYPNEKNTISLGINSIFEERKGGDMLVLRNFRDAQHQFFILNRSYRNSLDINWERRINKTDRLTIKGIGSWFYRNISTNVFGLRAKQVSYFTEASYLRKRPRHDVVAGLNFSGEGFKRKQPDSSSLFNYDYFTVGLFVQDDWRLGSKATLESGLRTDFHNKYGSFILPRVFLLYKITNTVHTRLGGGLGYKIPSLFNSEIDERDYRIARFDPNSKIRAERSWGLNWDVNFKKNLGELTLTINQLFYLTHINNPLVGYAQPGSILYRSETRPVTTKGFETWLQIGYGGLEAYLGYTFSDARKKYDPVNPYLELSARSKFASVISYEFSKRIRACMEAAYTGRQYLENGKQAPSYPFVAAMVRYDIGHFSFVLNGENLFDYRQTRKESILIPPNTNPRFKQIWAPIDGRVISLSMRISF